MPVAELLRRVTASELSEWMAYAELEPFGQEREDLRAGMISSPLVNLWIQKGHTLTKPSDWVLNFEPKEPMTGEQLAFMLRGLAAALGTVHDAEDE